jgi:hypothetical protein
MSERRDPYLPVLFVTYDRLAYTVHSLNSLLASAKNGSIKITIWDNNSTDGSDENVGLAKPMNYMFRKYKDFQYIAKVDNDTVLPFGWAANLNYAYDVLNRKNFKNIGGVSGWCLRPWGEQTDTWYNNMQVVDYKTSGVGGFSLRRNSYICGTGVLINMDMIRERGLLFEGEACIIGGWTSYCRIAHEDGWNFYFHMGVDLKLLNIESNHVLSNDFPEYDAKMKKVRDEGDKWWVSINGTEGIRKLVAEAGGYEELR